MSLVDTLVKRLARKAVVIHKQQIADRAFHLKIQGDDLAKLTYTPGEHHMRLIAFDSY